MTRNLVNKWVVWGSNSGAHVYIIQCPCQLKLAKGTHLRIVVFNVKVILLIFLICD
jgi:hypothetical protein